MISLGVQGRALVNGNVKDPRYTTLMHVQPSEAVKGMADDAQNRFVAHLISQLETQQAMEPLKGYAVGLREWHARIDAAIKEREARFIPEMKAQGERRTALLRAQRVYTTMHPQLVITLGDESLAESFFRPLKKPRRATEEETVDTDASEDVEAVG
ncbi:MAG: hypothetical protein AB2A00_29735 [Myxococcota bacterium]